MSDSVNKVVLGYYGKVPTQGDFVGKNLPRSFRDPWDAWLQSIIRTSQQQMGQNWIQHYLTCPLYHFALSRGICGEQAWLGVVIPSVDVVGRYYPMTLVRSLPREGSLLDVVHKYDRWLMQAEQLVMSCLAEDFSLPAFDQQVQDMAAALNRAEAEEDSTTLQRTVLKYPGAAWQLNLPTDSSSLKPVFSTLTEVLLDDFCLAYSLWWGQRDADSAPSLLLAKGLPPIDGAAAMLDGEWQDWGWQNPNLNQVGS